MPSVESYSTLREIVEKLKRTWIGFWRGVLASLAEVEMNARRDNYDNHLETKNNSHPLEATPKE